MLKTSIHISTLENQLSPNRSMSVIPLHLILKINLVGTYKFYNTLYIQIDYKLIFFKIRLKLSYVNVMVILQTGFLKQL